MPIAVGSFRAGGRWRLSEALLKLSPSALRWWAGGFCAFLGSFVIVAPQEFSGVAYRGLQMRPLAWGLMFVVAGGGLLAVAALRPRRGVFFVAHALAAASLAYLGGSFASVGGWTGAVVYSILAAGLFATGLLPERPPPSSERRHGDALSLLFGLAAFSLGGVLVVMASALPDDIYRASAVTHRLLGALLLLGGPLLVAVHLRPGVRRSLTWLAHGSVSVALIATALLLALPSRTWTGLALYGSAGLTLATLPWLRRRGRHFDPASLATRLALTFGAITSVGLLLVVALLQSGSQREAESLAAASQRDEALSVARNVVDYLELVGARSEALAAAAGRAPWTPRRQRALIAAAAAERPRIAAIGVYGLDGAPLAEVGRRPIQRLSVLRLLREHGRSAEGAPGEGAAEAVVVRLWPQASEPLLLASSPIPGPLGRPRGLLVIGYDAQAVLWRLSRPGLNVRLVDQAGNELAAQRASHEAPGGSGRLEALAPVPGLDWRVIVERPLSVTLASVRRERLLAFSLLLAAVLGAGGAGVVAARVIAAPLRRLAAAADQLAAGNPDVPLGVSGVSELDRLSANFRDMRQRLEARTRERERLAGELRARADALAEADRRKDEFLAMLAHELRNPLGAISNAAYLLDQLAHPDPRVSRSVGVIGRQMRHLTRMVDDLLDVSRITRGKVELKRAPLDLAEVVARTAETFQPMVESRGHELVVSLPAEPLPMHGDATRLDQVLGNLLRNAVLYTDPGGHLEIAVRRDGEEAVLRVSDDGIGIGEDLLPRVFEPFSQGHQSLDRPGGGLGIGLTLVRQLVELHGGSVRASSDGAGRGSTFEVRLPLAATLAARGGSRHAGMASAAGPDARRRDAGDAGTSSRSADAADGSAPPPGRRDEFHHGLPAGQEEVEPQQAVVGGGSGEEVA